MNGPPHHATIGTHHPVSLFKKLLGGSDAPPAPATAPATQAAPSVSSAFSDPAWAAADAHWRRVGPSGADDLLDCSRIDWNAEEQRRFVREVLPRWRGEYDALPRRGTEVHPLSVENPHCGPRDAEVAYAMVCERIPTRLIEVGCGYSTHVLRSAIVNHNMPCELIAIDPDPVVGIGEVTDAQLAQPVQEIPLSDFEMLMAGEMLVLDTTHLIHPGGEVLFLFERVLPILKTGVIVGMRGVRLPRQYGKEELQRGWTEQSLVQAYLTGNSSARILFSGGWVEENLREEFRSNFSPATASSPARCSWLWWELR